MRKMIALLFFIFPCINSLAQQNYKPLLDTFFIQARTNFKDIAEAPNDSSVFSPSKLNADVGEIKIGRYPNVTTLNWIIPLAQSGQIRNEVQAYIQTKFSGNEAYEIVSDGQKEEGYQTTGVYAIRKNEKPLLICQTLYYEAKDDNETSNFSIIIYGK